MMVWTRARQAGSIAAVGIAVALFALTRAGAERPAARAQQPVELREAYRLVDTWDSAGLSAPATVLSPRGIDITGDEVWLVDAGNRRLQAFAPDRTFLRVAGGIDPNDGGLREPRDVAVTADHVFVTDPGAGRVVAFDRSGRHLPSLTQDLGGSWGIATDGQRVYVTRPDAGEIVAFDDGAEVARWSVSSEPRGLDVDGAGRIHVADPSERAVLTLNSDGRETARLPVGDPPRDVAVDGRGDRYILADVEGDGQDVILWFEEGELRSRQALFLFGFQGVAVDPAHGIYATVERDDPLFHGVQRYPWRPRDGLPPPSGRWDMLGFPLGRFDLPVAADIATSGDLWLSDDWPRAQRFDSDGDLSTGAPSDQRVLPGRAVDLAAHPSGDLVASELSVLHRVRADGQIAASLRLGGAGSDDWVTGMALHPGGDRMSIVDGAGAQIREVGLTQTLQPVATIPLPASDDGSWELYWDVAVEATGPDPVEDIRSYAVNRTRGTVDILGGSSRRVIERRTVDGIPARISLDPDGNQYILTTDGIVWKHDPTGRVIAGWDAGAFSTGSSRVVDVAAGNDGRVYTVDRLAETIHVWAPDPDRTPEPPLTGGGCRLRGDKRAAPGSLRFGGLVTVTLEVGGDCPNTLPRADIVLAIDRSGSMMDNGGITATKAAALAFLDGIDLSEDRVALVAFNNNASLEQPLTDDVDRARAAIDSLTAVGGTDIAEAIRTSAAELFGPRGRSDARPVLLLMTDGRPNRETKATLEAAREARRMGAQIFTIGFGDIDPMVMALAASTPEDAYFAADPQTLVAIYREIADRLTATVLARTLEIEDELPGNMAYVRMLDGPEPQVTGRTLRWTFQDLPFDGVRVRYLVEPTERGTHPTNVEARAAFIDGLGLEGSLRFPVPEVQVAELPPTITPTSTPVPTATPTPSPLFLPIAVRQNCTSTDIGTDVVIVMDNSGSMAAPVRAGGPSQLEAAVGSARTLVERMRPSDRAAIVTFNAEATLVQTLTNDQDLLFERLDGLTTEAGTRIDLGLDVAWQELTGERAIPGNTLAVVLLTDGVSDISDDDVLAAASDVRDLPARLFVIGLGQPDQLDGALLREVAGRPGDFFEAPSADELDAIYASIARTIECANLQWP